MSETAIRVVIRGRVQGVWYRAWTQRTAGDLGLNGWVRNCPDGSVEALFSGLAVTVRTMVDRCRQGPPAARVDAIEEYPAEPPSVTGFHIAH